MQTLSPSSKARRAILRGRDAVGSGAGSSPVGTSLPTTVLFILTLLFAVAGCSRLRLPAIDSTGQRIFNPLPATTGLALPGSAGEGRLGNCLHKLGDPLNLQPFALPSPAFSDPVDPPKCLTPQAPAPVDPFASIGGQSNGPCVPSSPCAGDCLNGPPAVLIGNECKIRDYCQLPRKGKRGCILLSPQKIVAPVGGEVVLLSGICGTDGFLQVAQPLEWMLTPESVGTFIQVGDDDPGFMHTLASVPKAVKHDPSYAHGVTSTKPSLITRGNLNPNDDVSLEKGQTWISVSSPSEGTSKVTVLAPESDCWDQRKATATIYWVDARWIPPSAKIEAAGIPVQLTTQVFRSEGDVPAEGWKVRYTITEPGLAAFSNTANSSVVEATVGPDGNATVTLVPTPGTSGTTGVLLEVIRPGGKDDNLPTLTLFQGRTFVTWSAPQIAIRAGAPQIASFGVPFEAVANVSNPGDQPATNVRVTLPIPNGVRASSKDTFATNTPGAVIWDIQTLPPQTELDLFVDVVTESSLPLTFEARGDGDLFATDTVTVDVYRPSLVLSVTPEKERYEVGELVTFNVDVRNTGDRPLSNLQLVADAGEGMVHESNRSSVRKAKEDGPLQPGQIWEQVAVTFIPTDPGQRCITVRATADAGQADQAQSCVIVINQPVPTPDVAMTLVGRPQTSVGEEQLIRGVVANNGGIPLEDVRVALAYDPQLDPIGATSQFLVDPKPGQYLIEWLIPRLEPQTSQTLEGNFRAIGINPRSVAIMTVESRQGARAREQVAFQILPAAINQPRPEILPPRSVLPDPGTAPRIPGAQPIPQPDNRPPPNVIAPPPQEPEALGLNLRGPQVAVLTNEPIRYTMEVSNSGSQADSQVRIRFNLPDGVQVRSVDQRPRPDMPSLSELRVLAGQVYLPEVRSMAPGETLIYEIILESNQPQTFNITAQAVSAGKRPGSSSTVQTLVVSPPQ